MTHNPIRIGPKESVVVLTGAGVSAESGIRTFRDHNGLWNNHRVEVVASPEGWAADPSLVWRFYGERRAQAATVRPNPGHLALAELERALGPDRFCLVTQNVDSLHEAAGSKAPIHIHGELFKSRCSDPCCQSHPFHDERSEFGDRASLPRCACGALVRPHIVWFGEVPFELHAVTRRVQRCDLFVTVGSSGVVYPAAGLVREMLLRRRWGERVRTLYVGLERPENADAFDEIRLGPSGQVLPGLFDLEA
jgi:NAD-dependent deacetylase